MKIYPIMKKQIIILSLFLTSVFTAFSQEEYCDTLKLKVIETFYCTSSSKIIGKLDGAVINLDTLSVFYPGMNIVNISNDTFSANDGYIVGIILLFHTETYFFSTYTSLYVPFQEERIPNDTLHLRIYTKIDLIYHINSLKNAGVDFEEITHWQMITAIFNTGKDGQYTNSVINASSDTSTFYVVKTPVNITERTNNQVDISVFPNPAQTQFTVTNTENAIITMYNLLGQKVRQIANTEENTIIQTEDLSAGMYVLKVENGNAVFTRKVQVVK